MVKEETLFLTMVRAKTGKYQLVQLTAAPDLENGLIGQCKLFSVVFFESMCNFHKLSWRQGMLSLTWECNL